MNISVRTTSGTRKNANTYILTFNGSLPPKSIKIGYLNVKVEVYMPNPLRCFNCQKYGHGKKFCKSAAVCARCGESHPNDANVQCTNPPKCANCSGNHPAYSKDCPRWTIEKQVRQVKATNNMSFVEARRKVETEAASHMPTIAAIISRPPGNQDARPASSCTPLKHNVQTDNSYMAFIIRLTS